MLLALQILNDNRYCSLSPSDKLVILYVINQLLFVAHRKVGFQGIAYFLRCLPPALPICVLVSYYTIYG
ncbi:hypothetical protein E4K67_14740 [Desulfosporosinus fructosivorans]|uniref:Uncharacterized protein n=1 Tax=Desulfosporosinus fructosivorans TaxID=2018669 RepID=A0A4Z0R4F1_9FIRM|nr:hypothetical protein E4K67_14740 [Desulfosporosinus fructosivorans]